MVILDEKWLEDKDAKAMIAKGVKALYDSFIRTGFTKEEALGMCIRIILGVGLDEMRE